MGVLTLAVLRSFVPLRTFSEERLTSLLNTCEHRYIRQGQVLMQPGRAQTHACFLLAGAVRCQHSGEILTPAFSWPLHYRRTHQSTLIAHTDCSIFCIEQDVLNRSLCWNESIRYLKSFIASQRQYDAEQTWMFTILDSNLFHKVSPLNLQNVFVHLSPKWVRKGEVVIRQGDLGDCCYILREGQARVTRQLPGSTTADPKPETHLADVGPGRCFGEDALIHETMRNATITMLSDGLLMKLDKRDFIQLLKEPPVEMLSYVDMEMLINGGALLLDARTMEEYDYRHLENARSLPLGDLHILGRLLDSYQRYVVYCDSGWRSRVVASLLTEQGFQVQALQGGLGHLPPGHPLWGPAL